MSEMQRPPVNSPGPTSVRSTAIWIGRAAVYIGLFAVCWGGRWHRPTVQSPLPGLEPGSPWLIPAIGGGLGLVGLTVIGPRGLAAAWRGPRKWISGALLTLALLTALTAPLATDPAVALMSSLRLALLWLIFVSIVQLSASDWRPVADQRLSPFTVPSLSAIALALGMGLQALVALLQFVHQGSVGLPALGELDLIPSQYGTSVLQANGHVWLRAYGLSAHPNILGGYLAVSLLALLGLLVLAPFSLPDKAWAWGLPLLGLGVIGLIVSFSRSAWLGLLAGLAFLGLALRIEGLRTLWRARGGRLMAAVGMSVLVAAVTLVSVGDLLLARLTPTSNELEFRSVEERLQYQDLALDLIRKHPLGIGGDNFPLVANTIYHDDRQARPHNVPLLVTAELGPVGGLLWLILAVVPPLAAWRSIRRYGLSHPWSVVYAAGLIAVLVISLFDYYFWASTRGAVLWAALLGLWAAEPLDDEAT